jgi:serine/threonine protein kinase/tetratricopeptide (TPR) repeat protein
MKKLSENLLYANRYRLLKKLGTGGFSQVWKAEDTSGGDLYALKLIAPEVRLPESTVEMLASEYELTFALSHKNLVKPMLYDTFEGAPYLLLPLYERGSLADEINRRLKKIREGNFLHAKPFERCVFTEDEIAKIIFDIASALSYLHEKSVLHNDIKPANILISDDNDFLLTDFGISTRARMTAKRSTMKHSSLDSLDGLTIAYTAPEIFSSNPHPTQSSDIFSLGVMIYELTTGNVPWLGQGGLMLRNGAEIPDLPVFYSKRFRNLLKKCLSLDSEQRPTAKELCKFAELYLQNGFWEDFIEKKQIVTDETRGFKKVVKPRKRSFRKTPIVVFSLLFLTVSALVFLRVHHFSRSSVALKTKITSEYDPEIFIDSVYFSDSQSVFFVQVPGKSKNYFEERVRNYVMKDGELKLFSSRVSGFDKIKSGENMRFELNFPPLAYPVKSVHLIDGTLEDWEGTHFFCIPANENGETGEKDIKISAWQLARQNKMNLAMLDIAKKINSDSEDDFALHLRAIFSVKNRDYFAALKDLAVAIERAQHYENKKIAEENVAYHRILLAKIYNLQGNPQAAIDETSLVLNRYKDAEAYFQRGIAYSRQNKFVLALSDFRNAQKLASKRVYKYEIAHALYRLEKFEEAETILNEIIEEKNDAYEAIFLRGKICIFSERYPQAIDDMSKTLEFQPEHHFARFFRAFGFSKLKKFDEMCEDLRILEAGASTEITQDENFRSMKLSCKK